jgi:biopolymer transport protein ExbD
MKLGQVSQDFADGAELNITPLIDIVFILLIFFVVTTTFVHDMGLDIERPEATTASDQAQSVVRVAVSDRFEITVDARPTSAWRVEAEVRDRIAADRDASVLLVADKGVPADTLVGVLDACRRGGAKQVAVAVEPAPGGAP